jgi:uncharacterized protein (DUF433 family)
MSKSFYSVNPQVLGGTAVFANSRVPVTALFDYLSAGDTVNQFLDDFPSVTLKQVQDCLEESSTKFKGDDEAAA